MHIHTSHRIVHSSIPGTSTYEMRIRGMRDPIGVVSQDRRSTGNFHFQSSVGLISTRTMADMKNKLESMWDQKSLSVIPNTQLTDLELSLQDAGVDLALPIQNHVVANSLARFLISDNRKMLAAIEEMVNRPNT